MRKTILITAGLAVVLVILISTAIFAVVNVDDDDEAKQKEPLSTSGKMVKMMCASTDYKKSCESRLNKAIGSNHSNPDEKDVIKAAIMVVMDEVGKALHNSTKLKSDDPEVNGAIEDCLELFDHAKDELNSTLNEMDGIDFTNLPEKSDDMKNWLSAVISYQQTCVDGFPEGKLKEKMRKAIKGGRELTSNALAMIDEASRVLAMLNITGFNKRRLLAEETTGPSVDEDGMPEWISDEDRRMLKGTSVEMSKPNVVVAKDGSGDFKTINGALNAMPEKYKGRYVIYIKEGVYEETVMVTKKMVNVSMYGDGSRKTIITGSKNFVDGVRTFQTATFAAIGDDFMAQAIGFRNTAGAAKHQAVALRVQSDRSIFVNCRMEAYQDTLYAQTHRQFYRSCVIAGTIDFIFGDAAAVFQMCHIILRKPLENQQNIVTAQGRVDRHETTGIVLQNCKIMPDKKLVPQVNQTKSYLGRPWKEYSRTIIMESSIDGLIHPDGWLPWEGDFGLKTLFYGEYNNKGPGAVTANRVKWRGRKDITMEEAMKFTVENFIQGSNWIRRTGTPVHLGLFSMRGVI